MKTAKNTTIAKSTFFFSLFVSVGSSCFGNKKPILEIQSNNIFPSQSVDRKIDQGTEGKKRKANSNKNLFDSFKVKKICTTPNAVSKTSQTTEKQPLIKIDIDNTVRDNTTQLEQNRQSIASENITKDINENETKKVTNLDRKDDDEDSLGDYFENKDSVEEGEKTYEIEDSKENGKEIKEGIEKDINLNPKVNDGDSLEDFSEDKGSLQTEPKQYGTEYLQEKLADYDLKNKIKKAKNQKNKPKTVPHFDTRKPINIEKAISNAKKFLKQITESSYISSIEKLEAQQKTDTIKKILELAKCHKKILESILDVEP